MTPGFGPFAPLWWLPRSALIAVPPAAAAPARNGKGGRVLLSGDSGMSTAEYAIGTLAAAAFAAVLYAVVTGDSVTAALSGLVQRALSSSF